MVVVELAKAANRGRKAPVALLLAGDEAQTVRPTDFEWGWLNDLLHTEVGTPAEYQLKSNLRSPRRIAELVNRVWDLYSHLEKHERPSGTGYAEIDDDATDQILYCTAAPGEELNELLISLSSREGLALVTLEDSVPKFVPEAVRGQVLTPSEAKGLDFHSVCVVDPGRHVSRITHHDDRFRNTAEIDGLYKRLAIDQLRVAVSRATERLIWLDISPTDKTVRRSMEFLNGGARSVISSCVPSAMMKTLEEEQLDLEERIQRCQSDARQYLSVKPEIAWSRAMQAGTLLGPIDSEAAVKDFSVRDAAQMTVAEICFTLACRGTRLPSELGNPDLFSEAYTAVLNARRPGLGLIIDAIRRAYTAGTGPPRIEAIVHLAQTLPRHKSDLEPWVLIEIEAKSRFWIEELEAALSTGIHAAELIQLLPPFYEALGIPDSPARMDRLRQRAIQLLIKDKQYKAALHALKALPERQMKLEAQCWESLGSFREAADCYREAGDLKLALSCYRAIPDLEAALGLLPQIAESHPAADSLAWMSKLQKLVAERPDKFTKTVTAAEKKLLEETLERALGVQRRKPAPAKKRAPVVKVTEEAPEKISTKAATRPRPRRGDIDDIPF
jgi:hypothetical protein